ncbi:MAG: SagB/ThcOx family dehydrogenase [Thermoleophilia bacterium]|nr:SagB/ThcOx family dehydrogenase [Thermoleophilia bacterium]
MSQGIARVGLAVAATLAVGALMVFSCAQKAAAPSGSSTTASVSGTANVSGAVTVPRSSDSTDTTVRIELPDPSLKGSISLEEAIQRRRSVREYADSPLTLAEVSQLLWATQGITSPQGGRAAPSAGGTYPLEVYVVAGTVTGLDSGVYRYVPREHSLVLVKQGDFRSKLQEASLNQAWVGGAPVNFVIAAVYERTTQRYGERGVRYVHLEAGHAAQNLCLQATALRLGAVTVGAFTDEQVQAALDLPTEIKPLYVIPVGRVKAGS